VSCSKAFPKRDLFGGFDRPEQWKPIPGAKHEYQVSNHGRVRRRMANGTWKPLCAGAPRYRGYRSLAVPMLGGKKIAKSVHVWVYLVWVGDIPAGMQVDHKDHVKSHNEPGNLQTSTQRQQKLDAWVNEVYTKMVDGKKCHKLTEQDVIAIHQYKRDNPGATTDHIAEKFGISQEHASHILCGTRWAKVWKRIWEGGSR
jgi:hypothetical protein